MTRQGAKMSVFVVGALLLMATTVFANEKCMTCHDDIVKKHKTTLHGKVGKTCEDCHGGGDLHMSSPSKNNIIRFGKGASVKEQNSACIKCHGKNQKLMFWDNSKHKSEDVTCVACHTVHKNSKPYAKQPEKCFECHKDIRSQANKFSHHPIIEGKVSCSDCHNPHGALGHGSIKAENTNQLCYKCHADKRGPYIWEHPPVEEDCMKCHAAHGTKTAKLLKEKQPQLCQSCHDWSRHPGTAYGGSQGFSGTYSAGRGGLARGCTGCHSTIHGSNAPGSNGKRFTR